MMKVLAPLALVLLAALAFGLGQPRSQVDWSRLRAVAFESDDWGLPGFAPSLAAWQGIDREDLAPGRFPPVYWNTTLETAEMVDGLSEVMARWQGRDGLPAVFQPNYVLGSLEYVGQGEGQGAWIEKEFPHFPTPYARPGLMAAVQRGLDRGVWYPELHARYHYDPAQRKERSLSTPVARLATERGITLFPDSEGARELGAWRSRDDLAAELRQSRAIFRRAFGREPGAIIAPDYTWNPAAEDMWQEQGLTVIQAKREQRNPAWGRGLKARLWKVVERRWAQVFHGQRCYLERNVRLEPVQSPDPRALVRDCGRQVRRAWGLGQPAVVETHRVNFAHLDPAVVDVGLQSMEDLLEELTANPAAAPVFLVDTELAQLQRSGASAVRRGPVVVVRNGTHGRKVLGFQDPAQGRQRLFLIPARTTMVVPDSGRIVSTPL